MNDKCHVEKQQIVDNPCWGSPLLNTCSTGYLLSLVDKKTAIIYESEHYIVLNKPPDLRMDGEYPATVHKLLTYWYPPLSLRKFVGDSLLKQLETLHRHNDISDNELRPCHQLDYATSGVLLISRDKESADKARESFENRLARKSYTAILYGHLNPSSDWRYLSQIDVKNRLHSQEEQYRRGRQKRRKETFNGYQPPSAIFQQWQQVQRNGTPGKNNKLSDDEWKIVWDELGFGPSQVKRFATSTWKEVKKTNELLAFGRAADVYNNILRIKLNSGNISNELPTFFCVTEEQNESFYVYSTLAQTKEEFAMRIHPDIERLAIPPLRVGDPSKDDFKPSLTRVVILQRGFLGESPVTKVLLEPCTGRRHQLRVHTALSGHPIVGDQTYATSSYPSISERMCLHSHTLEIPVDGQALKCEAPDPFPIIEGKIKISMF